MLTNQKVLKNKHLLETKIVNLEHLTEEAIQKIKSLSSRDLKTCNNILRKVEEQTKVIEREFIGMVRTINDEVMLLLQTLNLHIKDYENDLSPAALNSGQHFSVLELLEHKITDGVNTTFQSFKLENIQLCKVCILKLKCKFKKWEKA
jgi:DNA polymerase III delta prime subunit